MVAEYKSNNIKVLMQKHDLTIENLSQTLNLSVSTINRLLVSAKIDPKLSTLRPIAKFFGISIDELIGDRPLSLKPGDSASGFDDKQVIIQVPLIHWEQVSKAKALVPTLNFHNWNNWATAADTTGEHAYALQVSQASLPPPFYFQSILIIDPTKEMRDSDYVVVINEENPLICQVIFHGLQPCFKALNLNRIFEEAQVECCGTVVQWIIFSPERTPL